jgi:hypothetical protein
LYWAVSVLRIAVPGALKLHGAVPVVAGHMVVAAGAPAGPRIAALAAIRTAKVSAALRGFVSRFMYLPLRGEYPAPQSEGRERK